MRLAGLAMMYALAWSFGPAAAQSSVPNLGSAAPRPPAAATEQPTQQTGLPPTLLPLLTTPEHRAALLRSAHAAEPPGTPACPDATYVTTGDIAILLPPRLDAAGKIDQGEWRESIRADGCGPPRLLNAMTQVEPDGSLVTTPLLPGTTIADPQLQRDSVQYAAAGMGAMPPGCNQGEVVNTRYVGLDGQPPLTPQVSGAGAKPWTEVWTLEACGKQADVRMQFTPDATGTTIHATPAAS